MEPGLVDLLVREVEGEAGALPLLSHALHETWQRRQRRTLTVEGYQDTGGIRGAVAQSAEEVYDQVPAAQRPLLRDLLLRLVTPTPDGEPVRSRVPRRTVATDTEHEQLVELLVRARLVTSDDDTVELAHESLARAWPRLQTWLDDDVEGQRILRHLALAADAWDGMGRPDTELYRGVRLGQALAWRTRANPDLTPTERSFLDASAEQERAEAATAEQRLRHQAHQNRRLRALLAGAAVLLVVAIVAGLLALRQADRADRASVAADARRVGAQALLADDFDHSLLLGVEGVRLDNSSDSRSNLLAAMSRAPELIATTRTDGPPLISVESSPDHKIVGVGKAYNGLSFYDPDTRELLGSYDETRVWKFEFHPDGTQFAITTQIGATGAAELPQPSVRLVDAVTFEDETVQLGGIPESEYVSAPHYSADGRFLGAAFEGVAGGDDSTVSVWNLTSPRQPVLQFNVPGPEYELALSPDGSLLYVGHTDPPSVTAYDVATGRSLRSVTLPAAWLEVSPDGSLLAVAGGTEVVLLDAATLAERRRLQGHSESIRVIRFSSSGALLASGSDDRTAIVWDVATGERREVMAEHSTGVWGLAFGPDDDTLYTGVGQTLLTWDLEGSRRFIARRPLAEPAAGAAVVEPSPTSEAVAYTGCSTVGGLAPLQFLDVGTGRAGPRIETGVWCDGGTAWRPDGVTYATAGEDGFVRIWDWRTGQMINERHVAATPIAGLDYTGDGRRLVVAERSGTTYAIDAETLEPDGDPPIEIDHEVSKLYASPDNHTAIVLATSRFWLVDVDIGQVLSEGEAVEPLSGAFSPDGRRFAVASSSGDVRTLEIETGEWVGPPREGHDGPILFVDYAPDGATFATGGLDDIVIWDAGTATPLTKVLPELAAAACIRGSSPTGTRC